MRRGRPLAAVVGASALALASCQPRQAGDGNVTEPMAADDDLSAQNGQVGDGDVTEPMTANDPNMNASDGQAGDGDVVDPIGAAPGANAD